MRLQGISLLTAAVVLGCGGSSGNGTPDVQGYTATAGQISAAAAAYGVAAGGTVDVPACQSAHAAYDAQVRPMVDRLQAMSGAMDERMTMMGRGGDADMTCGADAMDAELAHHAAAACASVGMDANHAEAERHAAAMESWAEHQRERADELGGMMGMGGMGGMGGGATPVCHRNPDGTFTLGP